jgi:hypothetical protein
MYTPPLLREDAARIRKLDVDNQPVVFDRNVWRKHIPDIDQILKGIKADTITRQEIFRIFPNAPTKLVPCTPARQAELRRFFILVIVWGYGKVGAGPWRVDKMLKSPGFARTLCRASEECFHGLFLKAYKTLVGNINRLGPAFASKYLYFLCYNFKAPVKPLIFDSVVVETMRTLNWPKGYVDYLALKNNTPRRQSFAYAQYLFLLHNWAGALGCRADQIEYFLWIKGMGIRV